MSKYDAIQWWHNKVWMLLHYFWSTKKWWATTCCWDGGSWAADVQTQLDVFQEILGMFCDSLENKDQIITSTFINVKNLRSDHCAVQKQCNDLFIEFWKNISKNARKNFGLYSLEQQEKMTKVNQFFLQLALFGSLCIDQAEACLKVGSKCCILVKRWAAWVMEILKRWVWCHNTCSDSLQICPRKRLIKNQEGLRIFVVI